MLTLVDGSRLIVARVRVSLCTTGSERRLSMIVVRREGAAVTNFVRFFFFATFFFLMTVTSEGRSSVVTTRRVRRSTETPGLDSPRMLTLVPPLAGWSERTVVEEPVWPAG
jgi:hypothetical protein